MTIDYAAHLALESDRFLEAVVSADTGARVPTCPDWDADDLLWHLTEVQGFWAQVLERRPAHPRDWHEAASRPESRRALVGAFRDASASLRELLASAEDDEPAWTWHTIQTVGFIRRRQAHEAAIHRLDAELVATGRITGLDPELARDGILECLEWMYAGVPESATFTAGDTTIELAPTDGPAPVRVVLGRTVGRDEEGNHLDAPDLAIVEPNPDEPASVTIRATASHLDAWLWHRASGGVSISGRQSDYDRFAEIVRQPIL